MVPEIAAALTRPIVIDMRRVDQEWHAHLDQMEMRPDPLAYDFAEGVRLHTTISDTITPQFQSLTAEMTRRFDGIDRRLDGIDRRLNEHDRKLAVLAARMQLLFGAMGLLVTVLIAVFGILFTR